MADKTVKQMVETGIINGLFCMGHDNFSHCGKRLNSEYFKKHENCNPNNMRVDACTVNCAHCGNSARSLFLCSWNLLLCQECKTELKEASAPIS